MLTVIGKKPGLTSVEPQKEAGIDVRQAARVLNKLRGTKRVKVKGAKNKATYSLA